jgi:ribonuclease P protein component
MADATLPKAQRLCGKTAVEKLIGQGRRGAKGCIGFRYVKREDQDPSRMMVSVPKRSFKRAVKRNLLKRRIRESYRRQKDLLGPGVDILLIYLSPEVLPYANIFADMTEVLSEVSRNCHE